MGIARLISRRLSYAQASLICEEDKLASHGFACAPELNGNATLGGAARQIRLDQAVESAPFLPAGRGEGSAGVALATRFATVTLYGLSVIPALKSTGLDGTPCGRPGKR